jgi:hypothetical protein
MDTELALYSPPSALHGGCCQVHDKKNCRPLIFVIEFILTQPSLYVLIYHNMLR